MVQRTVEVVREEFQVGYNDKLVTMTAAALSEALKEQEWADAFEALGITTNKDDYIQQGYPLKIKGGMETLNLLHKLKEFTVSSQHSKWGLQV